MTRRQDCLDLDHSLLVLRSLGRFHGMAKILEQRGIISRTDYKPYPLTTDKNLIKFFMYYGLQTLSKAMEDSWGPEWYDVAQKLKIPCDVLTEKMLKLGEVDENRFNCLNHGDCWSNNMMFKYDWQNRPYTMRFLDLQVPHYHSPAYDITYFMHASIDPKVRHSNYLHFLNVYCDSLNSTLDLYAFEGPRMTLRALEEQMEGAFFIKVFAIASINAVTTYENMDAWDVEEILLSQGTRGINPLLYGEVYKKRLGADLKIIADEISKHHS